MAPRCPTIAAQIASRPAGNVPTMSPQSLVAHQKRQSDFFAPPNSNTSIRYVTGLEDKMEQLEALLKQLHPIKDYSKQLGPPIIRDSWKNDESQQPQWTSALPAEIIPPPSTTARRAPEDSDHGSSEDSNTILDVVELQSISGSVQKLKLRGEEETALREENEDASPRFHGKSSSVGLVGVAQAYKMMHMLEKDTKHDARFGSPDSISTSSTNSSTSGPSTTHRPKFWKMPQRERLWEESNMNTPDLIAQLLSAFPPSDLVPELIRVYFVHYNSPLPLLHRPTFERQWKENLHHTNVWFTAVCLGIFSIASRWSSDPRVIPEGATTPSGAPDWSLAGWQYCKMGFGLCEARRRLFCTTTLFEIQSFSLFATYLRDSVHRPLAWNLVGIAIRKAQDLGIHRKRVYPGKEDNKPTVESELWKRAFWCLIVLDRFESAAIGRSALVGEEDFDVELPLEVDDEFWEADESGAMFMQPKGVPANKIISFNQILKLSRVLAFALKTLYAVDKQNLHAGLSPSSWRKAILEHLDAALKKWFKSLPEHLTWSKQKDGSPFAVDAAVLQTTYRLIEMLIYQMFIPTSIISVPSYDPPQHNRQPLPQSSPLELCVAAARDCAAISQKQSLEALSTWPVYIYASQVASSVLLMKIYSVRLQERAMRSQVEDIKPIILEPLIEDLKIFLQILELAESRWGFIAPYLQELRQALPHEVFYGMTASSQPKTENCEQLRASPENADYRDMESQRPPSHSTSYIPLYPTLSQQAPQQPYSPTDVFYSSSNSPPSLSQPQLSHPSLSLSQRSQQLPYPPTQNSNLQNAASNLPYSSSRTALQPSQLTLPMGGPTNEQRFRAGRAQQFIPSPVDYGPPEYRPRQHPGDVPLVVKPTHGYSSLSYDSGRRQIDDGLESPSPYDRTKPFPPVEVAQIPTLHPARSLSHLDNSMPISSHDNKPRLRERQRIASERDSRYNVWQSQDMTTNFSAAVDHSHSDRKALPGLYVKPDARHELRPEHIPSDTWSANPSKTSVRHTLDSDILYHREHE
ncbi:hypothetical protein H0H87_000733 [Tephrocybe sp. NHM501043]|nr:hypothetical protein H0H87_000733 [Tephrocybe sp. NHM501043]